MASSVAVYSAMRSPDRASGEASSSSRTSSMVPIPSSRCAAESPGATPSSAYERMSVT